MRLLSVFPTIAPMAISLMIAASPPTEKNIMVNLVMNLLTRHDATAPINILT